MPLFAKNKAGVVSRGGSPTIPTKGHAKAKFGADFYSYLIGVMIPNFYAVREDPTVPARGKRKLLGLVVPRTKVIGSGVLVDKFIYR